MPNPPGRPLTPVSDAQKQQVALLMAQGATVRQIAAQTQLGLYVLRRVRHLPEVVALALQYRKAMMKALSASDNEK